MVRQENAHSDLLLDLDYNPNKLNTVATSGQDGALRFWDLRKSERCLLEYEDEAAGHINKVKYNKFHDQLLITGCSSTFVSLYRASSVSQTPLSHVPLADLNSSNTFIMTTTMTMGDAGAETDRMMTGRGGDQGEESQDKLI